MRYHFEHQIEDVSFSMDFDNAAGIRVTGVTSRDGGGVVIRPGEGHVDFHAEKVLLADGAYRVNTVVRAGNHVIDAVDGGYQVKVRAPEVEVPGIFIQPGEWGSLDTLRPRLRTGGST